MESVYYKFLNEDGSTPQGFGAWRLPKGTRPGKWMPALTGDIVLCRNGYHVMSPTQLVHWLGAPALYAVEVRGDSDSDAGKFAFRQARLFYRVEAWNQRTARHFAADCAERVLPIYERNGTGDAPRKAIEAARAFADGEITNEEMAAAGAAAWDAAWDAAWNAAWDAARAAARAAGDAARDAAWDAAWNAAGDAARAAAWDAAWGAARAAARAAAWAAAGDAEARWQAEHLCEMLGLTP